ncbi:hypothetical protein HOM98_00010 [Candidatus Peregrinibacteria bacterium]|jgi:hypothetical protein|nr:hypothetical protein [Candidatus Peregrinibacteria bacterium]
MKKLKYLWLAALPATVLLGVLLLSAISQAYYINEADYGIVEGVSYYVDNKTEAYRVDFEKAEWDIDSTTERIYRYRSSGQTIRGTQVLAFDEDGELESGQQYAWIANDRWLNFGWCTVLRTCGSMVPAVDMDLSGELGHTGDAYWEGKAFWTETVRGDIVDYGWVLFNWTCDGVEEACDIKDRVHTDLATGEVSGFGYSPSLGWIDFGNDSEAQYTVIQDLPEVAEVEGCAGFESLTLNDEYNVGDTFETSDVSVEALEFQWNNDDWTSDGFTEVEDGEAAGGSGQEVEVNNINLGFDFGTSISGLSMNFGEYGGNLNIEINDEFQNFENFEDIDGTEIGGVDVSVVNGLGNDEGSLTIEGIISSFAVGGQELWIDDVCSAGEVETVYVQPVVTLTPDPTESTKYGQGGFDRVPLANGGDGDEYYTLEVRLVDIDTGERLTDEYEVAIDVNFTEGSGVYYDQVNRPEGEDDAVFIGDVDYDEYEDVFSVEIASWAPTSNVNGYDEDMDGSIDFYFDHDTEDSWGYTRVDNANTAVIDSIDITVTGPDEVEFIEVEEGLVAPLWGLTDDQVDLKFAPAIEITNLGQLTDDGIIYSISEVPDTEVEFAGILAMWSETADFQETSFTVTSTLYSDAYYHVFDTNEDSNYVPADDDAQTSTTYTVASMSTVNSVVTDAFEATGYYVPVDDADRTAGLGNGSTGSVIRKTMLVNENGYYAAQAATFSVKSLFARVIDLFDFAPQEVEAAAFDDGLREMDLDFTPIEVSNPDLTISNIYRDAANAELVVVVENLEDAEVVTTEYDPRIKIYIDGVLEWNYSYDSLTDQGFLEALGSAEIRPEVLDEEVTYELEACVDPSDNVTETNEDNNCYETTIEAEQLYPDAIISRIYRDDDDNQLAVEQMNLGEGAMTDTSGKTYIWVDGDSPWTYSWSSLADQSFMDVNGVSEIRPETLTEGDHSIQACIDYMGIIEESDESNNCLFATIGAGADINPIYDTYISYTPVGETFTVSYYSNFMPLSAGGIGYNVPAYDTKQEVEISGSVTSTTADNLVDTEIEVVGSEIDPGVVGQQIYQRLTELTKGVNPGSSVATISGAMSEDRGSSLMGGALLYFEGDVVIDVSSVPSEVTIATKGGNIFIDSDLVGEAVGLIALADSDGENGNIYIAPDVTGLIANIYADGGFYSYDGDRDNLTRPDYLGNANALPGWDSNTRLETLNNQTGLRGSVISDGTFNGADDLTNLYLPDGSSTSDVLLAQDSSFANFREFVLCWQQTNEDGTPYDSDGDGNEGYVDGELDYGDMEECEDTARVHEEILEFDGDIETANNTPFYIEYQAPSSTLPVFVRN